MNYFYIFMNWKRGLIRLWVVTISFLVVILAPEIIQAQASKTPTKADLIKFDRERNFERLPRSMLTKEGDLIENVAFSLGVMKVLKGRKSESTSIESLWQQSHWYEYWVFRCSQSENYDVSPFTQCHLTRSLIMCYPRVKMVGIEKYEHNALNDNPSLFIDKFDSRSRILTFRFKLHVSHGPWYVVKAKIGKVGAEDWVDSFMTTSFSSVAEKNSKFVEYEYISHEGAFELDIPCKILTTGTTPSSLKTPLTVEPRKTPEISPTPN